MEFRRGPQRLAVGWLAVAGKQLYVLTARPWPENVPAGVTAARGGPAAFVEQLRAAGLSRDVHVLGGHAPFKPF
jgi:hypothetical protein